MKNIKNILFDCDGVLYQDLEAVFGQVSKKMTEYISKKLNLDLKVAKELQRSYFHKYHTSLNGLMIHHNIPPKEFLDYVHDINIDFLKLMVLNSNENATVRLDFKDLMPISLSTLEFDVQQTDIEYLQGTADFVYRQYTITQI